MKAEVSLTAQAAGVVLADHTTLRVGGPARRMITVRTEAELVEAVTDLDASGEPLLVLGGGSNPLGGDGGCAGTVVKMAPRGTGAGRVSKPCQESPVWWVRHRSRTLARTGPKQAS